MAKTRRQTRNITVKKEDDGCKSNLRLHNGNNTKTSNKITKRKPSQNKNSISPAQEVKIEEDTDTKSLLKSLSKSSKLAKVRRVSQEQINRLIDAVVNHNMSLCKAACAVKISSSTAFHYYNVYKNDPEKKIPLRRNKFMHPARVYTQQIENLIRYINDDKMSIAKASVKVNMNYHSSCYYYKRYLRDPNHAIPIPRSDQIYKQDQKGKFIGYIIDDKMTITAASRKANLNLSCARNFYRQYLRDNNIEIPVLKNGTRYTQDDIDEFIGSIANDKMTIRAASQKANMNYMTGYKYYKKYLKDHNLDSLNPRHTKDKIREFIGYIIDGKMGITAASRKAKIPYSTSYGYYQKYLENQKHDAPTRHRSVLKIE